MNPGGGAGWDEPPLDIQIPDDARELDRDVLAYHREQRAKRRRNRLQRLAGPLGGHGTLLPLLASILAVCLVAGAMLSVATFSPPRTAGTPSHSPTAKAASSPSATTRTSPVTSTRPTATATVGASRAQASGVAPAPGSRARRPPRAGLARPLTPPARPHLEPRVKTREPDRYDFFRPDGSKSRRPLR